MLRWSMAACRLQLEDISIRMPVANASGSWRPAICLCCSLLLVKSVPVCGGSAVLGVKLVPARRMHCGRGSALALPRRMRQQPVVCASTPQTVVSKPLKHETNLPDWFRLFCASKNVDEVSGSSF